MLTAAWEPSKFFEWVRLPLAAPKMQEKEKEEIPLECCDCPHKTTCATNGMDEEDASEAQNG